MYVQGSNDVFYTAVEATSVSQYAAGGIASGGTGGDATLTEGVRFLWVYDPETPDRSPSGFTGGGWFENISGSPVWYSIQEYNMTMQGILDEFKAGTRTNLNDVFTHWQEYVTRENAQGHDVVQDFQYTVLRGCWTNLY